MPEVVIVDEISTHEEALACRSIAERGVQLVGTAHGQVLENLLKNPTMSDLVGGIQSVTLGERSEMTSLKVVSSRLQQAASAAAPRIGRCWRTCSRTPPCPTSRAVSSLSPWVHLEFERSSFMHCSPAAAASAVVSIAAAMVSCLLACWTDLENKTHCVCCAAEQRLLVQSGAVIAKLAIAQKQQAASRRVMRISGHCLSQC